MIDAYTIGIRIALDDAVSTGIEAILAQLAKLDTATRASESRLTDLIKLGRQISVVQVPTAIRPATKSTQNSPTAQPVRNPDPPSVSSVVPTKDRGPSISGVAPAAGTEKPNPPMVVRTLPARAPQPRSEPDRTRGPTDKGGQSASSSAPAASYRVRLRSVDDSPGKQALSLQAVLPRPSVQAPQDTIKSPVRAAPSVPEPAGAERIPQMERQEPGWAVLLPTTPNAGKTERTEPSAKPPSAAPFPSAKAREQSAMLPSSKSKEELLSSARPSGTQSVTGQLILDGSQLGRWIADTLSTAVSRPASGMTGFDPRMTPGWPGTTGSR